MPSRSWSCRSTWRAVLSGEARRAGRRLARRVGGAAVARSASAWDGSRASQLVAWRIRRRLGEQDRVAKMSQLANHEIESLKRAKELFDNQHYDLSVVESWRALEARLRASPAHQGDRDGFEVHRP